jgi:hypothetical protein
MKGINTRHRSTSTPWGDAGAVCSAITEPVDEVADMGPRRRHDVARGTACPAVRVAANAMRSLMPGPNPGLAERSKSP